MTASPQRIHITLGHTAVGWLYCKPAPYNCARYQNDPEWAPSIALFCNECGNIWAQIMPEDFSTSPVWMTESKHCRNCNGTGNFMQPLYWKSLDPKKTSHSILAYLLKIELDQHEPQS